jgi:hypothetical protein
MPCLTVFSIESFSFRYYEIRWEASGRKNSPVSLATFDQERERAGAAHLIEHWER